MQSPFTLKAAGGSVGRLIGLVVFLMSLIAANPVGALTGRTVTGDWFDHEIRWVDGYTSYRAKWKVFDVDGEVVVCGAGQNVGHQYSENKRILRDLGFFIGGKLVMRDLRFFSKVGKREPLLGAVAHCKSTGRSASEFSSKSVRLGKAVSRRY
ncbi:hypothetical protein [Ovoidimarina sediminis]|uniref:hypothetical protein n=1 Tax=Ovoidimarina sediminis TaxID=3079856 RepID=UPI0029117A0B|nr:hypothetical protein [Rhodophyticola sp. MJ-SS7]MDU8941764.1 hypothetical protein [Rhodophyticola sp. MJ-SS7]